MLFTLQLIPDLIILICYYKAVSQVI
ncbi:unnamed protein product [Spirodela intermedia]|uniref:Uncharacterized protein n=2 Tax=Spirodela intermedia TaxID=51605 RepID=A0A7I8LH67_SPIIN|nr:unnamed protein product [Spirodela intermedia]CAA6671950.1 unnamed protein product [Spirodela intermedia]CAA6675568.1 unnamed protein product [Spirodela intermedia]CAA7409100.1 unnamed protein product [Spirodela intermedia]